jgi:hypothetical protein
MKKLQLDLAKVLSKYSLESIIIPILIGIIMLFPACDRNNIEKINEITTELNAPTVSFTNTEIIFSIHGKGLEANQDLTDWRIKNTSGTINVEDED